MHDEIKSLMKLVDDWKATSDKQQEIIDRQAKQIEKLLAKPIAPFASKDEEFVSFMQKYVDVKYGNHREKPAHG